MHKIDKGIPVPPARLRQARYPFADMGVGDSFFAERSPSVLHVRGAYWSKKLGHKYQTRGETQNGVKGARIWRVE